MESVLFGSLNQLNIWMNNALEVKTLESFQFFEEERNFFFVLQSPVWLSRVQWPLAVPKSITISHRQQKCVFQSHDSQNILTSLYWLPSGMDRILVYVKNNPNVPKLGNDRYEAVHTCIFYKMSVHDAEMNRLQTGTTRGKAWGLGSHMEALQWTSRLSQTGAIVSLHQPQQLKL